MAEQLVQVAFISYVLMQMVNALLKPAIDILNAVIAKEHVAERLAKLWPLYLTAAVAGTIGYFADFNILPMFPPMLGRILTSIGIGLGPSFLHDTFSKGDSQ